MSDTEEANTNLKPKLETESAVTDPMVILARCMEQMGQILANQQSNQTLTTVQVRPDASESIDKFAGFSDDVTAEDWLNQFNQISALNNWSDADKLTIANIKLVDTARNWNASTGSKCANWDAWETAFRSAFIKPINKFELWKRMEQRIQQRDELVDSYMRDKQRLCAKLEFSMHETKEAILSGLRNHQMSLFMREKNHGSIDDLLHDMMGHEQFVKDRDRRFGTPPKASNVPVRRNAEHVPTNEKDQEKMPDQKCFNCQESGHYARECTMPKQEKYCTKCNKNGHGTKDCVDQENKSPTVLYITHACASHRTYKSIDVDNVKSISSILDTGSCVNLMKIKLASALSKNIEPEVPETLEGIGGTIIPYSIVRSNVAIDGITFEQVRFLVVSDETFSGPDVLMGTDVIDRPNLGMIRKQGQTMFVRECENEFLQNLIFENNTSVEATVTVDSPIQETTNSHLCVSPESSVLEAETELLVTESPRQPSEVLYENPEVKIVSAMKLSKFADDLGESDELCDHLTPSHDRVHNVNFSSDSSDDQEQAISAKPERNRKKKKKKVFEL